VRKVLKQLLKRALTLSTATFLIGCNSQSPQAQSEQSPEAITQPTIPIALKSAIEELRVIKIKVKGSGDISKKEYGENLADLVNITQKAYGNPKALAAVKSAVEGHQLALNSGSAIARLDTKNFTNAKMRRLKVSLLNIPISKHKQRQPLQEKIYLTLALDWIKTQCCRRSGTKLPKTQRRRFR
jgi:hypothetical protein